MPELLKSHIIALANSVAQLRACLSSQSGIDALDRALAQVNARMSDIESRWGNFQNLKNEMNALDEATREELNQVLMSAQQDQIAAAELIRLAQQRNIALQAHVAQTAENATYSNQGTVAFQPKGRLVGKV